MAKTAYVLIDGVWEQISGPEGPAGVDGAPGADGPAGPPGTAYLSAAWNFNQNTVVSPASGTMRMNATTYAATNTLWVSETDRDGLDRTIGLNLVVVGDQIIMQSAQGRALWNIVSQADSGTYRTFTVTLAESTGSRPSASSPTTLYFATVGSSSSGGGGFLGPWAAGVAYKTGSLVTYSGYTWGTASDLAAGYGPPPTSPVPPMAFPAGQDLALNAPNIIVASTGLNVSSPPTAQGSFTTEAGEPVPGAWAATRSAWWKYTPASSGSVTFSSDGSDADSVLSLYKHVGATFAFANLTNLGYGAANSSGTWDAKVVYSVVAGETYYIQIGASSGTGSTFILNLVGARATAAATGWAYAGGPFTIVLSAAGTVPAGTPAGTVIIRTAT
jgi:hypothetical protein